jgi:hypothetical protein
MMESGVLCVAILGVLQIQLWYVDSLATLVQEQEYGFLAQESVPFFLIMSDVVVMKAGYLSVLIEA